MARMVKEKRSVRRAIPPLENAFIESEGITMQRLQRSSKISAR
jgi:hypothetical protein